jgi:4-carboxymuconolactone decarboxylase
MAKQKVLFIFSIAISNILLAQKQIDGSTSLSPKERCIVTISAYAAQGNLPRLQIALNDGLDAGLTISEGKEMLVQLYAYAGFPRSLNALHSFMAVLEERKKKGILDQAGKGASSYPSGKTMMQTGTENQTKLVGTKIGGGVYEFAPTIDRFLKEHLFGAIFGRDNLNWKTREIVTISALAAMEGVEPQLYSHCGVGIHNGLTRDQLSEIVAIIETDVSKQRGIVARNVLQSVIDQKPYTTTARHGDEIFSAGEKINNDNFIGSVWLNQLIQSDSSNTLQIGNVTFEPGSRTNWHLHPAGQILIITDGIGYYQEKGSAKRIIKKGDVVKCPPNIPHWHGASKNEQLVQIAVTSMQNGTTVWLQQVTEEEYESIK